MMSYPTLRRQNAWSPLSEFRREMDKLFDDYWSPTSGEPLREMESEWNPACDVAEAENHYLLTLEVPGIPKDQIKLEVIDNQISISGERNVEEKKRETGSWYTERRYGKFHRSFSLPSGVDVQKVEAHYQDGILKVYVPKAESAKPRQVKISNGSSTGFFGKLLNSDDKTKVENRGREGAA